MNAAYSVGKPTYAAPQIARRAALPFAAAPPIAPAPAASAKARAGEANMTHAKSLILPVVQGFGEMGFSNQSLTTSRQSAAAVTGCVSAERQRKRKSSSDAGFAILGV